MAARKPVLTLTGHQSNVNTVAFSTDGAHILSGSYDGTLRVWRAKDGAQQAVISGHGFGVNWVAVSARDGIAASASTDETVRLWNIQTGTEKQVLLGQQGPVFSVAIAPDGSHVVSGGRDGTLRIWELGTNGSSQVFRTLPAHSGIIWSLAFSADSATLLSAGEDRVVRIWDLAAGKLLGSLGGDDGEAAIAADPSDRGAMLFRKCAACHSLRADGGFKAGPTLHGVFGRRAGTLPGYPYSEALKQADIIWTADTVSKLFEVGPDVLTPGSKMPLQRMPKAEDRKDLVEFLQRVTGQGR
jgi:cytochrome c